MFYVNADTNLEEAQLGDMLEVLRIPYDSTFTGLLYMDRNDASTSPTNKPMQYLLDSNGVQTTAEIPTTIYAKMIKSSTTGYFDPPWKWKIEQKFGELDTMDVTTAENFFTWANSQCQSGQFKVMTFNMHGGGVSGISGDDTNGHSGMSIPKLGELFRRLFNKGIQFDLVGYDTCLMSDYSNAQAIIPYTKLLLSSLPTEPGYGWDYTKLNTKAESPVEYGKTILDAYVAQKSGPNQLVLTDLTLFEPVITKLRSLMDTMIAALKAGDVQFMEAAERARANSPEYPAVWETFVKWFHITGETGEEKSQMDLGGFLVQLGIQCPAIAGPANEIVAVLDKSVIYRHTSAPGIAVCTGPGCAPNTHGIALWYKKRKHVLGAYKYYLDQGKKLSQIDVMVDSRLETEIKEGLPYWYKYLAALYRFEAKDVPVSLCSSGTAPGSSTTTGSSTATACPIGNSCTLNSACSCQSPQVRTQVEASTGEICYQCASAVPAPAPQSAACPSDGRTCTTDVGCKCDGGLKQTPKTANGQVCYVCESPYPSPPPTPPVNQCPVGGNTCSTDISCSCPPSTNKGTFYLGFFQGFCYACTTGYGRSMNVAGPEDSGAKSSAVLDDADDSVAIKGPMAPDGFQSLVAHAPQPLSGLKQNLPLLQSACESEPLCKIVSTKKDLSDKLTLKGDIAPFVDSLEMFISVTGPYFKDGRRLTADLSDEYVMMKTPAYFPNSVTFAGEWRNFIAWVVSPDDECAAFTQITGEKQLFENPQECSTGILTATLPVFYYKNASEYTAKRYELSRLTQEIACDTLRPIGTATLHYPNDDVENGLVRVPKSDGGLVQPLMKKFSRTTPGTFDPPINCAGSDRPFDWAADLLVKLVPISMPLGPGYTCITATLVSNSQPSRSTEEDALAERFIRSFSINPQTGLVSDSCNVEPVHSSQSSTSSGSIPVWAWVLIGLALLCLLAMCGYLLSLFCCPTSEKKTPKKRGIQRVETQPTTHSVVPESTPMLSAPPSRSYVGPPQVVYQSTPQPMVGQQMMYNQQPQQMYSVPQQVLPVPMYNPIAQPMRPSGVMPTIYTYHPDPRYQQ